MQTNKPDYNCHSLVTRHAHPVDGLTHPMPWRDADSFAKYQQHLQLQS